MGLGEHEIHIIDARRIEKWPRPDTFSAAVITGSAAMVTDQASWSVRTADWLRETVEMNKPVLGVCYGHQLLASALGGHVDYNPHGREIGSVTIHMHDAAKNDPLFRHVNSSFLAHVTHQQSVIQAPANAVVLAYSDLEPCQAFRVGDSAWGLQFHPEFSARAMRTYVDARWDDLKQEGLNPQLVKRNISATPLARRILRQFVYAWRSIARKKENL